MRDNEQKPAITQDDSNRFNETDMKLNNLFFTSTFDQKSKEKINLFLVNDTKKKQNKMFWFLKEIQFNSPKAGEGKRAYIVQE